MSEQEIHDDEKNWAIVHNNIGKGVSMQVIDALHDVLGDIRRLREERDEYYQKLLDHEACEEDLCFHARQAARLESKIRKLLKNPEPGTPLFRWNKMAEIVEGRGWIDEFSSRGWEGQLIEYIEKLEGSADLKGSYWRELKECGELMELGSLKHAGMVTQGVRDMQARIEHLETTVHKVASMAGHPDPAQGCRNIIAECKEVMGVKDETHNP
jgi:hypothetical protein